MDTTQIQKPNNTNIKNERWMHPIPINFLQRKQQISLIVFTSTSWLATGVLLVEAYSCYVWIKNILVAMVAINSTTP